ncbi:ribonuclease P [Candidatus Woesearchaeota archaeon]|nr:ribonuclease P [Candidatus Woesearchaeota archaeon]
MAIRHVKKEKGKKRALDAIESVFSLIDLVKRSFPELLSRYSYLIQKISMRNKVTLSSSFKRRICKHCKAILIPSVNSRVRLRSKHKNLVYYCSNCKKYTRFGYSKVRE